MENLGEKYLNSIGVVSECRDEKFLNTLVEKHVSKFSFNNLEVLLKDSILSLETEDLYNKVVVDELGGYCFEHNKLFFEILKDLGFEVSSYLGRVLNRKEHDEYKDLPRTHRITVLTLNNEKYLVDVGFGGQGPTSILKMNGFKYKSSDGSTYRVMKQDNENFKLQKLNGSDLITLYEFDLGVYTESDFKVANFYTNKSHDSKFVNNLFVLLKLSTETRILNNLKYSLKKDGERTDLVIKDSLELLKIVEEKFNITLNSGEADQLFNLARHNCK